MSDIDETMKLYVATDEDDDAVQGRMADHSFDEEDDEEEEVTLSSDDDEGYGSQEGDSDEVASPDTLLHGHTHTEEADVEATPSNAVDGYTPPSELSQEPTISMVAVNVGEALKSIASSRGGTAKSASDSS